MDEAEGRRRKVKTKPSSEEPGEREEDHAEPWGIIDRVKFARFKERFDEYTKFLAEQYKDRPKG